MLVLGSKAHDRVTGFAGIVVARVEYLGGTSRIAIQPQSLHDGAPIGPQYFEESRCVAAPRDVFEPIRAAVPAPRDGGNEGA